MDKTKIKKDLYYIQVAIIIAAIMIYAGVKAIPHQRNAVAGTEYFRVERVIDGDTLKLADGRKVRLIGVDTPEVYYSDKLVRDANRSRKDIATIQGMGRSSSAFTKKLCSGKRARIEFDVDRKDGYGRTLAYVYLEDGTFLNAKILEEGYGQVLTIPPNVRHAEYFLGLERRARKDEKGLWKTL